MGSWLMLAWTMIASFALAMPSDAASPAQPDKPVILVVGDSLSAGYGVAVDATWVALLERKLTQQGYGYRVVNSSVSGDTTGGALNRLPRALDLHRPAIVILELGGNDGLRGLPLKQVRANFEAMLKLIKERKAQPVLIGMRMPTNYGPEYADAFHALYGQLAKEYGAAHLDFFLDNVALDPELMQSDGIHPNTKAQPIMLDNLWPVLQPLLKK
jgi:acyl-CoA thioesterase-1